MKYLRCLLIILFLSSFVGIVSAQNNLTCQYTELNETKENSNVCKIWNSSDEYIQVVYDKDGNRYENPAEIKNVIHGGYPAGCGIVTYFDIQNKIPVNISLKVKYTLSHSGGTQGNGEKYFDIAPLEKVTVQDSLSYCWGTAQLSNFEIFYLDNNYTEVKIEKKTEKTCIEYEKKKIDVCKQCNGKNCLNDGQNCSSNFECGSGICNIAGVCGTQKVADCSEGYRNCNNESCLEIGTKKIGEEYWCEFECEKNYGENGICKIPTKEKIFKFIFIFIFSLILIFAIYLIIANKV
jgi:hypothetical protein